MDPVFICGPRARHADSSQKGQKRGYCEPCHQAAHVPCVAAYLARPQDGPARYRADHLARCETGDPQCRAARGACLGLRGRRGGIRHIHDRKGAPSVSFSTWPQTAPTTRRIRARNPGNPSRKPTKVLNRIQARPFQPQCADRGPVGFRARPITPGVHVLALNDHRPDAVRHAGRQAVQVQPHRRTP